MGVYPHQGSGITPYLKISYLRTELPKACLLPISSPSYFGCLSVPRLVRQPRWYALLGYLLISAFLLPRCLVSASVRLSRRKPALLRIYSYRSRHISTYITISGAIALFLISFNTHIFNDLLLCIILLIDLL